LGTHENAISFPRNWLDRETALSDPRLWRTAQGLVANAEAFEADDPILKNVRQRTAKILADERRVPRLKELVTDGHSVRTISRTLASRGTSYREIVEAERRDRAMNLINEPALSLAEIADALGFPDKSSFGRSFRHWFGETPGQFRQSSMILVVD
jgi:AraC-like DNA-binding protein